MKKHYQRNGGQRPKSTRKLAMRVAAFLLCLSMAAGLFPGLAWAADDKYLFDNIARLESAALYDDAGVQIQDSALIEQGKRLELRYAYTIEDTQCTDILPNVEYYLRISPHLQLPTIVAEGILLPMKVETDTGAIEQVPFGVLHADGQRAWVTFLPYKAPEPAPDPAPAPAPDQEPAGDPNQEQNPAQDPNPDLLLPQALLSLIMEDFTMPISV